ncbi:hypothetical protein KAR91_72895 [Candidatus Pacearchaeota archaeon]|nr:hypothetical protein [Candidatus Pacearchaeota archaeon]
MRLPETISVWNAAGGDGFGGITWEGPFEYSARIAFKADKFTDVNGDQLLSTAVCYSEGAELQIDSKVFFGSSASVIPVAEADDVRQISRTPSGITNLKKLWFS